jgi:hypothetical protein
MLPPDPVAILGLAAVALCWFLGVVLFRTGPAGSVARRLSLLLTVEGVTLVSSGVLDFFLPPEARAGSGYALWMQISGRVHLLGDGSMLALYPLLLTAVLDTPLVRPFAHRNGRRAIVGTAAGLVLLAYLTPITLGVVTLYVGMASLFVFAMAASLHAWHRAPTGVERARAGAFAVAFGIRDLCWGFSYVFGIKQVLAGAASDPSGWPDAFFVVYTLGTFLAVPGIAYGILRTQLFDIDLRLRWTLKQSTLAGVFVALLYVVTEGAQQLLSSELGTVFGLLAAAALVFFLAPLQRFAERVAGAAMPNTRDTPEYVAFRKLQVYEAALQDANRDGGITRKERALLERLRDSLGISPGDAARLERDLTGEGPELWATGV